LFVVFMSPTLAHYTGGVGVVGSNPAAPTIFHLNDC